MDEDELKGKFRNIKGRVKQAVGAVTGDKKAEAEGAGERVAGAVEDKVGSVKRHVRENTAADDVDDEDEDLESE